MEVIEAQEVLKAHDPDNPPKKQIFRPRFHKPYYKKPDILRRISGFLSPKRDSVINYAKSKLKNKKGSGLNPSLLKEFINSIKRYLR